MDALPLPTEPCLHAAAIAGRAGLKGGGGSGGELKRMLNFLTGFGVVEAQHDPVLGATFRHTSRSLELRSGGTAHSFAMVHLSPTHIRPWWRVAEALEAAEAGALSGDGDVPEPFRLEHAGQGVFDFYSDPENAGLARHFDALMGQLSAGTATDSTGRVAGLHLWREVAAQATASGAAPATVVDVGGGEGHLLAAVLGQHPGLHGILLDRQDVIREGTVVQDLHGALAARTSLVGGDFFQPLPNAVSGAAVFMLKWILHDWSDAKCRAILRGIRAAIPPEAGSVGGSWRPRLLLIEEVVPEDSDESEAAARARRGHNDADMWVIFGGKERTVSEFSALLREEGFETCRVTKLAGFSMVAIEAEALPVQRCESQAQLVGMDVRLEEKLPELCEA